MKTTTSKFWALGALSAAVLLPALSMATTFKWSSASDIPTLDIHSQNNALGNGVHAAIYDSLVYYNSKTFKVEPRLATSWKEVSPTQFRLNLRSGVKFSDGSDLTADDVVFSLLRAMAKTSNFQVYTQGFKTVNKVDARTVDIILKGPNPVLLNQLTELRIMSKAWAEKNKSVEPKDGRTKDETFAHRNAMGSGPFMVKDWQPDQRLVLVKNPNWWGWKDVPSNVTEIVYTPIKNEATRAAALLSGEVDFVLDPSPQDLARMRNNANLKVIDGVENRTIFLGMDQWRDELLYSSVKGKNPFKDKRVRQAFYQAIDIEGIKKTVMRGASNPSGLMFGPGINGYSDELNKRLPFDPEASKKLLAEAGYPNGFSVDMNCPNDRYVNDGQICEAVAANLARIGVKVKLNAMPFGTYFPKILRRDTSFYMLGWTPGTYDSHNALNALMRCVDDKGSGQFNLGSYCNPKVDELTNRIQSETDKAKRDGMIKEAFKLHAEDIGHLPLHQQALAWGVSKKVDLVQLADNFMPFKWITVKK